jgi:hypothetical protein
MAAMGWTFTRMDEQNIPKKVFIEQMLGKRPVSKPRKRWIDR